MLNTNTSGKAASGRHVSFATWLESHVAEEWEACTCTVSCLLQVIRVPRGAVNRPALVRAAGVFPRGPGQVLKLRAQIKAYVAGQLAACTQAHPAAPDEPFVVRRWADSVVLLKDAVGSANALQQCVVHASMPVPPDAVACMSMLAFAGSEHWIIDVLALYTQASGALIEVDRPELVAAGEMCCNII